MPIPNADFAFVPQEKLTDHLLNEKHPVGGGKAKWFAGLGYQVQDINILEKDLLTLVRSSENHTIKSSSFGIKYAVSGKILTPKGFDVNVVTVWIVETPNFRPRLVTAYPGEKS
jgi:hypothetical protein